MDCFERIAASYNLFVKLNCCSKDNLSRYFGGDASLAVLDLDKMRLHIMNCLTALRVVEEKELKEADNDDEKQKLMKGKVFRAACLMMIDTNFDNLLPQQSYQHFLILSWFRCLMSEAGYLCISP
jgi:hypothetical protein